MRPIRYILALILLSVLCSSLHAQTQTSIEDLELQIRRAEQEIKASNALLEQNKKDQKLTLSQLKLIQNKISSRRKIVSSLNKQITLISSDIITKNTSIKSLENNLAQLKKEYARMIYAAYKNYRLNNFLLLIFSSKDFNDLSARIYIMKRYNKLREEKAVQIDSMSLKLNRQVVELNDKKGKLDATKQSKAKELSALGKDESQFKKSVTTLKSNESKITSTVKAKQAQIASAQQKIQSIIAEEARKNKKAQTQKSAKEIKLDIELTGRFDQNKGKLPMPVRGGVVIDEYGIHAHPTQAGLKVNNRGVNIAAPKGSEIRSVFDGVVTKIFFVQGLSNCIIVRHGNYQTLYANLASVSVKVGEKVAINQCLGNISASNNQDEHMVHFEIWHETTNLNPSLWLKK